MMRARHGKWFSVLVVFLVPARAPAAPAGTAFTYQGQLKQGGAPVSDTCDIEFALWSAVSGGSQAGPTLTFNGQSGNPPPIAVANGLFTVELDFGAGAFDGQARWLAVSVACPPGAGVFTTLTPRQKLTPVPYAVQTRGLHVDDAGNVGIGTATPGHALHVVSDGERGVYGENTATTGPAYGVYGKSDSSEGKGVFGEATAATGFNVGVLGRTDSTVGRGVVGRAWGSSGANHGVLGRSDSTSGRGVSGLASTTSGETYGGHFESASTDGRGVFGWASATTGANFGVTGRTDSTSGLGVYGFAGADTGFTSGVRGQSNSIDGRGVSGYAGAASGPAYGGLFKSASSDGHGVFGLASATSGTTYGVYGQTNSPNGFAGYFKGGKTYFEGNVGIGTANPAVKLEVAGSMVRVSNSNDPSLTALATGASSRASLSLVAQTSTPSQREWRITNNGPLGGALSFTDTVAGARRLVIDSSGRIGVGTDSPDRPLAVRGHGSNSEWLSLKAGTTDETVWHLNHLNGGLNFAETGVADRRLFLEPGGNVGIGTGSPSARLDVHSETGDAVRGLASSGGGKGVVGLASGLSGTGVYGSASGDQGKGVYGFVGGPRGTGVYGYNGRTDGTAVAGRDNATGVGGVGGVAILGDTLFGVGVLGRAATDFGIGVLGEAALSGGKAGVFRGNVQIQKQLTGDVLIELGEGLDYAEGFDVSDRQTVVPGMVLVIDPDSPGKLAISRGPYDRKVAGIAAGAKGLGSAIRLGPERFDHDVALAGRVYCNVDATREPVEPGDLLTTATAPGYAMKVTDYERAQGAVLGKAMQRLARGQKSQILVLVTLQ